MVFDAEPDYILHKLMEVVLPPYYGEVGAVGQDEVRQRLQKQGNPLAAVLAGAGMRIDGGAGKENPEGRAGGCRIWLQVSWVENGCRYVYPLGGEAKPQQLAPDGIGLRDCALEPWHGGTYLG